ncbi:hypothetical protein [Mucilaginibacter ginsenosidivorax]|uniref:Uncharacterized protein n=1 Tax=Mucilaginibacter ginsenosidivorax TaxID=862126 RepID=A0A5B8VWR3_9SPHI|nr:hypothetical protein [Mucilaginibacter ginsenosidivorax]QEC74678.1 hypothetical protein FSB76_01465 [Mucilaginibacter ginsenosidivorax]
MLSAKSVFSDKESFHHLHLLSELENLLTGNYTDDILKKLDEVIVKVQASWAFTAFSALTEPALQRYFSHQLLRISGALEKCCKTPGEGLFKNRESHSYITGKVCFLTDDLLTYYGNYPDKTIPIAISYRQHYTKNLKDTGIKICKALDNSPVNPKISEFLKRYIEDMTDDKNISCSLSQLVYFKQVIEELSMIIPDTNSANFPQLVYQKLIALELNQFDVLVAQQEEILREIAGKPKPNQLSLLKHHTELFSYLSKGEISRYDDRWPPLSLILSDWLQEVKESLEPANHLSQSHQAANKKRLKLEFSVSHLACLIRLFFKERVVNAVPLTEIFDFFAENFSTKRQEFISAHGLSKEYYSKNQVTAAEMKSILQKMITRINQDYFPVVAAIGVTVFFR